MNLRELIAERIFFAVDEKELKKRFQLTEDEVLEMSDLDLFELYETLYLD